MVAHRSGRCTERPHRSIFGPPLYQRIRLLLGTWMDELRFPGTRKALADSGLMDNVLEQLPDTPELRPALDVLRVKLAQCREAAGGKA